MAHLLEFRGIHEPGLGRCPDAIATGPPGVDPHVAAIGPTQVRKRLRERREGTLLLGIVFVARHEHANAPDAVALLRATEVIE